MLTGSAPEKRLPLKKREPSGCLRAKEKSKDGDRREERAVVIDGKLHRSSAANYAQSFRQRKNSRTRRMGFEMGKRRNSRRGTA